MDEFFDIEVKDKNYVNFIYMSKNDFMNLFGLVFQDHTTARVYGIDKNMPLDINSFMKYELVNRKDTVRIWGPKQGETILYEKVKPKFILLLQEYYIQMNYSKAPPAAVLQGNASTNLTMKIKTKYAIWDNINHQMVGWGSTSYSLPFIAKVNRNAYMQLIGGLSKKIIEHSPFYSRHLEN